MPAMVRRGREVWLYVHEEVPGITMDRGVPLLLHPLLIKAERPSRVVRYAFACTLLAKWTDGALRSVRRGGSAAARRGAHVPADACDAPEDERSAPVGAEADDSACAWRPRGAPEADG